MDKEEIIKGNEIIMEFIGFIKNERGRYNIGLGDFKDPINYHLYWEKIMPVVEKIEAIHDDHHGYFGVHISSNSCSIQGTNLWKCLKEESEYPAVYCSDPNAVFPTKIESTWYNVVEFIKWYNTSGIKK